MMWEIDDHRVMCVGANVCNTLCYLTCPLDLVLPDNTVLGFDSAWDTKVRAS